MRTELHSCATYSPVEQNPATSLGNNHQTLHGFTGRGDAMMMTANSAVQALHHVTVLIYARDQPVGTWRRPGLLNAERLDRAELHRFKTITAGCQRGHDPMARLSLIHISEPTRLGMISYA